MLIISKLAIINCLQNNYNDNTLKIIKKKVIPKRQNHITI